MSWDCPGEDWLTAGFSDFDGVTRLEVFGALLEFILRSTQDFFLDSSAASGFKLFSFIGDPFDRWFVNPNATSAAYRDRQL